MGQWACPCGQRMTDYSYPDENGYYVYSDHDWEKMSDQTDSDDKIYWYDIPAPTFSVYKCPTCGRLMVFGKSNRFLTYKPEFNLDEAEEILTKSVEIEYR